MRKYFLVGQFLAAFFLFSCSDLFEYSSTGGDSNSVDGRQLTSAEQIQILFRAKCAACHGADSSGRGGLNYILDTEKLQAEGLVIAGNATDSPLFKRVNKGEMPPSKPLSPTEVALIGDWINQLGSSTDPGNGGGGSGNGGNSELPRRRISENEIRRTAQIDLVSIQEDGDNIENFRYLTIHNEYNSGRPQEELDSLRSNVSRFVNSLSTNRGITAPDWIDSERLVARIDIRDYNWSANDIRNLERVYPYRLSNREFLFRADWFIFTTSQPPFYHEFLNIPGNAIQLESALGINVALNIQRANKDRVIRAGFKRSGVSINNRVIERHKTSFGGYWKSYDFVANAAKNDIFALPAGPGGRNGFVPAGGEVIFNLPNGLQAYMLLDSVGNRIDIAPTEVVFDRDRPEGIINGISCMGCHASGILAKNDEVADVVLDFENPLGDSVKRFVRDIYGTPSEMAQVFNEDTAVFEQSILRSAAGPWAVNIALQGLEYEQDLNFNRVAEELDLTVNQLEQIIRDEGLPDSLLIQLNTIKRGIPISRENFEILFQQIASRIN